MIGKTENRSGLNGFGKVEQSLCAQHKTKQNIKVERQLHHGRERDGEPNKMQELIYITEDEVASGNGRANINTSSTS